MKPRPKIALSAVLLLASASAFSAIFTVPPANQALIGQIKYKHATSDDSLVKFQQQYDIGYNAIEKANPQLNMANSEKSLNGIRLNCLLSVITQSVT